MGVSAEVSTLCVQPNCRNKTSGGRLSTRCLITCSLCPGQVHYQCVGLKSSPAEGWLTLCSSCRDLWLLLKGALVDGGSLPSFGAGSGSVDWKSEVDALTERVNLLSRSIEDFQSTSARLCSHIEDLGAKIESTLSRSASVSSLGSVELLSSPATPAASKSPKVKASVGRVPKPAVGQKIVAFSGMANPLSNLYPTKLIHGNRRFSSSEQAIQFAKAELYGDQASAMKILSCHNPIQCLQLGKQVVGFRQNPSLWYSQANKILQNISFSKFQSPHLKLILLATENCYLV